MAREHDWFRSRPPGIAPDDFQRARQAACRIAFQRFGLPWLPVVLILGVALLILSTHFAGPLSHWLRAGALLGPLAVMLWGALGHLRRRLHRQLRLHGAEICDHCGYAMPGNAGDERCPECGTRVVDMNPIGVLRGRAGAPLLSVLIIDHVIRNFPRADRPSAKELCITWQARFGTLLGSDRSQAEILTAIQSSGGDIQQLAKLLGLTAPFRQNPAAPDSASQPS